jgi:hypothetical protein
LQQLYAPVIAAWMFWDTHFARHEGMDFQGFKERGGEFLLGPDAIAELYLQLHRQPRSAWSHEIDVRRWSEKF